MPLLKRLLNGPAGAVVAWAILLGAMGLYGTIGQLLLFGREALDWAFLLRWPILWIVYFWLGMGTAESLTRWFAKKFDR